MLGRWGAPKVWKSELQKLQNEVLRRPKALPEASWRSEAPIGTLWGRSLGALGSPLGAPGFLLGEVLGALGVPGGTFFPNSVPLEGSSGGQKSVHSVSTGGAGALPSDLGGACFFMKPT